MQRQLVELTLPLASDIVILHPENAIVRFGSEGHYLDFGIRCYLERENPKRRRNHFNTQLTANPGSFNKDRAEKMRELISLLSEESEAGGTVPATLRHQVYSFFLLLDWCDVNHHQDVLRNEKQARLAFRAYVESLRERVQKNDINTNTAAKYQNQAGLMLASLMAVDDLGVGIRQMRMNYKATEITQPPDEVLQGKVLALCEMLFNGLSRLVLNQELYPYKLDMPEYLGWSENYLWVFPARRWFISPPEWNEQQETHASSLIDYANGRFFEIEEVAHHYSSKTAAKVTLKKLKKAIDTANADHRHHCRRSLAMLAHNAFVLMYIANTGMNWAVARLLSWNDEYELGLNSQGFREIKYRANGRQVSFSIQSSFLPTFKRYLELRRYLLDGTECHTLFFTFGSNLRTQPRAINSQLLNSFYRVLRRIDPDLKKVLARALRAAKSDWLIRHTDIFTAALVLQNSESTVLKHYTAGSQIRAAEEISTFFERLSDVVVNTEELQPDKKGMLGSCIKYGDPHPIEENTSIRPDCHQPEGCLSCDKYIVHADESDTRKLFSCRYCISQSQSLSASQEHFDFLYGEVIIRIDAILDQIRSSSVQHAELVDRIKREVEEDGQLDPYWESKLEMLMSLGVVV